jgi:transposase
MDHLLNDLEHVQQRLKELERVIAQRCGVSQEAVLIASMPGVSYFTATSLACRVGRFRSGCRRCSSPPPQWGRR